MAHEGLVRLGDLASSLADISQTTEPLLRQTNWASLRFTLEDF